MLHTSFSEISGNFITVEGWTIVRNNFSRQSFNAENVVQMRDGGFCCGLLYCNTVWKLAGIVSQGKVFLSLEIKKVHAQFSPWCGRNVVRNHLLFPVEGFCSETNGTPIGDVLDLRLHPNPEDQLCCFCQHSLGALVLGMKIT